MIADSAPEITVVEIGEITPDLVEAFDRLVPALVLLSPAEPAELVEIAAAPASVLLVARTPSGAIVGSLTLPRFCVPTGLRAWIEDVVVDESSRGAGAGESLVIEAVHRASSAGAKSVDLTSRPSREAANRLYLRLGFEARSTNVYRRTLKGPGGNRP